MAEIKRCIDPNAAAGSAAKWQSVYSPLDAWPIGSIFINTTATSPATLLGGGTWARFGSGQVLISQGAAPFAVSEAVGGAQTHVLAEGNLGAHDHTMAQHFHSIDMGASSGLVSGGRSVVHQHAFSDTTSTTSLAGSHSHLLTVRENPVSGSAGSPGLSNAGGVLVTKATDTEPTHSHTVAVSGTTGNDSVTHTHTIDHNHAAFNSSTAGATLTGSTGSATPVNHMPPYIVVYMWKRTA